MNLFNRIFTILVLLALIPLAAIAMVSPREGIDSLHTWLTALDDSLYGPFLRVIGSLALIVASFALLLLEVRRPPRPRVVVGEIEGAIAELSIEAIAQRLRRELTALPDVRAVNPTIRPRRGGVDVRLDVSTNPDVDVPSKAAEVGRLARESLEQRMGLKVGRLWVNIAHEAGAPLAPASPGSTRTPG